MPLPILSGSPSDRAVLSATASRSLSPASADNKTDLEARADDARARSTPR